MWKRKRGGLTTRRRLATCPTGLAVLLAAGLCWAAGDLRLIDAVKRRDHKALTLLLAQKADVNGAQPDGATALAWAAFLDDTGAADSLLAAGAKANTSDEYGETPLTLACANGDAALAAKLLQAGANAKAARWNGETALMIAANTGSVDTVKLLMAHGADVNAAEQKKGQTALMWAAAEGHADVVEELIGDGAAVNAASNAGFTPLVFAAMKDDAKSVRSLIAAGADPNFALPDGTKTMLVATAYKSVAAAEALADAGADPNVADRAGNTPLHVAAQLGSVDLVKKLLAKGANPNAKTAQGGGGRGAAGGGGGGFRAPAGAVTPLFLAAKADQVDVMRALVAGGADATLKAQDGSTLLMAAAGSGHLDAVRYAWELDPHADAVTTSGDTVVHAAVSPGGGKPDETEMCKVIDFLAEKGAPLDTKDARGRTPINVADGPPFDKVVAEITRLVIKAGGVPTRSKNAP